MKIHKFILFAILMLGANFIATNVYATNLMDIYDKALANDPAFKAARAAWLADRETLAISRADLLPILNAEGTIARNRYAKENSPSANDYAVSNATNIPIDQVTSSKGYNNSSQYSLQLTQPIFNFGSWANVWEAQAIAKKAKATFMAEEESLLSRTAKAYFAVLQAKDVLAFSRANKASVERLFIQAKHKFDVGLIPITDLEDARKNYDLAISTEIGNANDLNDKFEQLNEITGTRYDDLEGVKNNFPLLSPKPADIEQWVKAAEEQNFVLIAARFDTIAAREAVKSKNAGHLPILNATANYQYQYTKDTTSDKFGRNKTATAGLKLDVPIFSGGKVLALARQADYQYQAKLSEQEKIHRSTVSKTRQAYLGILSNISKIKADQQAIKSAESSLRANQASYTVGTRTMADILKAQADLYDAQKTLSQDEYTYIMQLLTLKELTGILGVSDLQQINSWLEKQSAITDTKTMVPIKPSIKKKSDKKTKHKKNVTTETTIVDTTKTTTTVATAKTVTVNSATASISNIPENAAVTTATNIAPTNTKNSEKITVIGTEQVEAATTPITSSNNTVPSTSQPLTNK